MFGSQFEVGFLKCQDLSFDKTLSDIKFEGWEYTCFSMLQPNFLIDPNEYMSNGGLKKLLVVEMYIKKVFNMQIEQSQNEYNVWSWQNNTIASQKIAY